MNSIPNRKAICDVLMEKAEIDKDIVVLCSDSRGSASMTPFAEKFPEQYVEMGIAEQNLVSVASGLAKCNKKSFALVPACFLSTRSYEQCKVDVAYSDSNVKLIGISGGISYGALGMTHHSAQDIAAMTAVPNMRVYLPSDRFQTEKLIEALLKDNKPAYIRVGRNAVEDIYTKENIEFQLDKANILKEGKDILIIACGEMVKSAIEAAELLEEQGLYASVLDMYCVKPIDVETVMEKAKDVKGIVTIEEHSPYGGMGSIINKIISENNPKKIINLSLPDNPVITGNSKEVFEYYGLNAKGILEAVGKILK